MVKIKTVCGSSPLCAGLLFLFLILVLAGCAPSPDRLKAERAAMHKGAAYTLDGQGRADKPAVVENRLALAAGDIAKVGCSSFATGSGKEITDPDEIGTLISLLESGLVVEELPHLRFTGVALNIAYDEERKVSVHTTPGGEFVEVLFHGFPWVDVKSVYLRAPELIERLHGLAGWRYVDAAGLKDVSRVTFSNDRGSFELDDANRIEPLVAGLRQSTYTGPTKCGFGENRLDFYTPDGVIHGVVAGDGCPIILLNGNGYRMTPETYSTLRQLVEERGLSLVPVPKKELTNEPSSQAGSSTRLGEKDRH